MNKPHKYKDKNGARTKAAILWSGMCARCLVGGAQQKRSPRYAGSTISDDFVRFDGFCDWYKDQPAFNLDGYEVDKDLSGLKHYSRETSYLIPKSLNLFLSSWKKSSGNLPVGVRLTRHGKYVARIRIGSKGIHLGTYNDHIQAGAAYIKAKNEETKRWVNRLEEGEFLVAENVIDALRKIDWSN